MYIFLSFFNFFNFGGLGPDGKSLFSKTDEFSKGVYVIDSNFLEFRIFSKDLFPTLLYCSAMKATISVPHVCHAVLSMSCASALSKNASDSLTEKTLQNGETV